MLAKNYGSCDMSHLETNRLRKVVQKYWELKGGKETKIDLKSIAVKCFLPKKTTHRLILMIF